PLITIYIFLALTAGGPGNMLGALVGAVLVVCVIEGSRFLHDLVPGLSGVQVAATREMAIGILLILAMRLRPRGLVPERPLRAREVGLAVRRPDA
ncbi:MAG: branched-chain amino acid ABC transporter permease, partial [Azospirillaceae bacterium]